MTKILLIDDEEINSLIFTNIIEGQEEIESFHFENNGWSALTYLRHCEEEKAFPDLIFVDLNMPEMHGFDFIEYYENTFFPNYPNTKLIILTSSVLNRDKTMALQFPSVMAFMSKSECEKKLLDHICEIGVN